MSNPIVLKEDVGREQRSVCCPAPCLGYAEQDDVTDEEDRKVGCGRYKGCCSRAFVCARCGTRLLAHAHAPDYN